MNEVQRRIRLCIAAYQYELQPEGKQVMTDAEFDEECLKVDLTVDTPRPDLDKWWRSKFQPFTGSWINTHPDLERIREIYNMYYGRIK